MKKRLSALLVAAVLLLGASPAFAIADDTVAVVSSTGVGYPSIRRAVLAAADGDTVTVTKDHEMDCSEAAAMDVQKARWTVVQVSGKSVTLDLNGKKITASPTFDINIFAVENGGSLTINDSVGGASVHVTAAVPIHSMLLCFDLVSASAGAATLTVNGGTFRLNSTSSGLFYAQQSDTVTVNGGTFLLDNVATGSNGSPYLFNAQGSNTKSILVNGGTFNDNVMRQHWDLEVKTPGGVCMQKNGDLYTMVPANAYVVERIYASGWRDHPYGYMDLNEAVSAAQGTRVNSGAWSGSENIILMATCEVDETLVFGNANALLLKDAGAAAANTIEWTGNGTDPMFTVAAGNDADGAPIFLTLADFVPLRDGYVFGGWFTDAARTAAYDLAAKGGVEGGISLYAKWTEEAPAPTPAPEPAPTPAPEPAPETGDPAQPMLLAALIPLAVLALIGKKRVCG